MSGPKLSAYELEQMRKAELERIQREIIRLKSLAMQDIQEAQRGKHWCVEECQRLEYQQQLLNASTLSTSEKQHIDKGIQSRIAMVQKLKQIQDLRRVLKLEYRLWIMRKKNKCMLGFLKMMQSLLRVWLSIKMKKSLL